MSCLEAEHSCSYNGINWLRDLLIALYLFLYSITIVKGCHENSKNVILSLLAEEMKLKVLNDKNEARSVPPSIRHVKQFPGDDEYRNR